MKLSDAQQFINQMEIDSSEKEKLLGLLGSDTMVSEENLAQVMAALDQVMERMENELDQVSADVAAAEEDLINDPELAASYDEVQKELNAIDDQATAEVGAAYGEYQKTMDELNQEVEDVYEEVGKVLDEEDMAAARAALE